MAMACQIAKVKLARFVDSLAEGGTAEKIGAGVKAAYIGGVSAPLKGVAGNVAWGGYKALALAPTEAGFDYLMSVGRSIAGGGNVPAHQLREVVNTLDAEGFRQFGEGFKAGASKVSAAMKEGRKAMAAVTPGSPLRDKVAAYVDGMAAAMQAQGERALTEGNKLTTIKSPVLRSLTQAAFIAVDAVDRPFYEAAMSLSLYGQAKLSAVRSGLKGSAREARVQQVMANPSVEQVARATEDAMYATFKDKPQVAEAVENGRQALRAKIDNLTDPRAKTAGLAISALLDITVPFTGVPSSVAAKGVAMTPLGAVGGLVGSQAQRARSLANASLGTSLIALGYYMASDDQLTAGSPKSANMREDNEALGRKNYSMLVGDSDGIGGFWADIRTLGPLAIPMFVGAALRNKELADPDADVATKTAAGLTQVGKSVVENTFAQGIKRTMEAVTDAEGKGAAWAAGLIPIPAALGQVSRAIDGKEREADTFGARLASRTPLRMLLPEKAVATGAQEEKGVVERLSPFSPFPLSKNKDTPEFKEMRRLGISLGLPERKSSIRNESVEFSKEQYRRIVEGQGAKIVPKVQEVMQSAWWQAATDEERKRRLQTIVNRVRDEARRPVRNEIVRELLANGR